MAELSIGWKKTEIVAGILGAIAIPVAVFLLGNWLSGKQKEIDKKRKARAALIEKARKETQEQETKKRIAAEAEQREEDRKATRILALIGHLSSDNNRAQLLATNVMRYLAKKKLLDPALVEALLSIIEGKGSVAMLDKKEKNLADAAEEVLALAKKAKDPNAVKAAKNLRSRVYISTVSKRGGKLPGSVKMIVKKLQSGDYLTRTVVSSDASTGKTPVVMYYKKDDKKKAVELVDTLKTAGFKASVKSAVNEPHSKKMLGGHFRISFER